MNPFGLMLVAGGAAIAFTAAMVLLYHWLFRPDGGESIRVEVEQ